MENGGVKFLLITANVGSLFEEYGDELQKNWIESFHKLVSTHQPYLIALHLQEVGGKTHNVTQCVVKNFFEELQQPPSFQQYSCIQNFMDEEYTDVKYTAMGCSYFIHKSLKGHLQQWNFNEKRFVDIVDGCSTDQLSNDTIFIQKFKFPLSCYSKNQKRLPRKGFTWCKWRLFNKVFVLLNIHLTHDACNIEITKKSPTQYSSYRKRSLEYTLEKLDNFPSDHRLIFGDFNVRPDTKELVEYLMNDKAERHDISDSDDVKPHTVIYKSLNGNCKDLLRIKERLFEFSDYNAFNQHHEHHLLKFDNELNWLLKDQYSEMPIHFRPTYPHIENPKNAERNSFANVRCPSWCDRIIIDQELYKLSSQKQEMIYDTFGEDVALGDHKPVFMVFNYPDGLLADQ